MLYRFFYEGIDVEERKATRVLIIKMGAPGDVLRTTPILYAIKRKYREPEITWITDKASAELLEGNPYIKRIIHYNKKRQDALQKGSFDLLINPENTKESAMLAERANAVVKLGYGMSDRGFIYPFNEEAEHYLEMAGFDDVKKANRKSYQEILFEMCGFEFKPEEDKIILPPLLTESLQKKFKQRLGLKKTVIGLHTGAGRRWKLKKWRIDGFANLAERILKNMDASLILLGGKMEKARNKIIKKQLLKRGLNVIDATVNDDLKKFINTMALCDVVVCGDTLALHLALGLGKRVVALFGPTSPWEIELYGQGVKIFPEMDCICCYRERCSKKPNCMDAISVDRVYEEVVKLV